MKRTFIHSLTLTVRATTGGPRVVAETSDPGLAAGSRVEGALSVDPTALLEFSSDLDGLRGYGAALGSSVFRDQVGRAFLQAQARADQAKQPLHVLLSVEDEELKPLKWERLSCLLDGGWQPLRLQQRTPYSFYLPSAIDRRYPAISRADLRALVVVADFGPGRPFGLAKFDARATVESVRRALGQEIPCRVLACEDGAVLPGADGPPTLDEICRQITAERFPILHLVCHGKFFQGAGGAPGETVLFLMSEPADAPKNGPVAKVTDATLLARLGGLHQHAGQTLPHFTFLCSCETASADAEQALGGLGQRLVRELGMPAVLAMTAPVPIPLAERLAAEFYRRLRVSGAVDQALGEACAGEAGRGAVLIPALFSRLRGQKLFDESGPLTASDWHAGLNRLRELVAVRAPVLADRLKGYDDLARPALQVWKGTEQLADEGEDGRRARSDLARLQADLNELCQDVLEGSFDALARGVPLRFPAYDARCPFPGLGVFDATDGEDFRPFFFGRERPTDEVCRLLAERRFVAVLGGSGSGKSSLVRAGVLGALRGAAPNMKPVIFLPGETPLAELRAELAAVPNPDVVVVDQFEELFTLCTDPETRAGFLRELLAIRDRCPVVVIMRADFLGECAEHDELHRLLDADPKHVKLIQPLRGDELRDVMERQAGAVGLQFEPGLAAQIFADIEGEPGAMPLLQHCLSELWKRRHGRWLRLSEYASREGIGGVRGAISRTAEEVVGGLSETERDVLLPYMFEQLVRIDTDVAAPEQRRDTRRRVDLTELTPAGGNSDVARNLAHRLASAKLLVITNRPPEPGGLADGAEVEVVHEALIRHWQRLRGWLNAARDTARIVQRIRTDADNYAANRTPDNLTLRGTMLEEAGKLLAAQPPKLSGSQADYVTACIDLREREREERERQTRQELEQVRALAESRQRSAAVFRRATGIASFLLVIAVIFGIGSYVFYYRADQAKKKSDQALQAAQHEAARGLFQPVEVEAAGLSGPEVDAFAQLAALGPEQEPIRLKYLDYALEDPVRAARLSNRVAYVVQAVVGLESGRRVRVEEVALKALSHPATEVRVAAAMILAELGCADPSSVTRAAGVLVEEVGRPGQSHSRLAGVIVRLWFLCETLPDAQALSLFRSAGQRLSTQPKIQSHLAHWFSRQSVYSKYTLVVAPVSANRATAIFGPSSQTLASTLAQKGNLDAREEAARTLGAGARLFSPDRTVEILADAYAKEDHISVHVALAEALGAATEHLQPDSAAVVLSEALSNNSVGRLHLAESLGLVTGRLAPDRAATILAAALAKEADVDEWTFEARTRFDRVTRAPLVKALAKTTHRLTADQRAITLGPSAEALAGALTKTRNRNDCLYLAQSLEAVARHLPADRAAAILGPPAVALAQTLENRTDPYDSRDYAASLGAVARHLPADRAAAVLGPPANALAAALTKLSDQPQNSNFRSALAEALVSVVGQLTADQAGVIVEILIARIYRTTDPQVRDVLAWALEAVARHLRADRAAAVLGPLATALATQLNKTVGDNARWHLTRALVAVAGHLPTDKAAAVLGPVAVAVAGKLSKTVSGIERRDLLETLVAIIRPLSPAQAATVLDPVTDALVTDLAKESDTHNRKTMIAALVRAAPQLPPERGTRVLVAALMIEADWHNRQTLAAALETLAEGLSADRAITVLGPPVAILAADLGKVADRYDRRHLANSLGTIGGWLPPDQTTGSLTAALAEEVDLFNRQTLAVVLAALASRLPAERAAVLEPVADFLFTHLANAPDQYVARFRAQALGTIAGRVPNCMVGSTMLLTAWARISRGDNEPAHYVDYQYFRLGFSAAASRFVSLEQVVGLLKHPLCVGEPRVILLKRAEQVAEVAPGTFPTQWHLVDWLSVNRPGFDLSSPPVIERSHR